MCGRDAPEDASVLDDEVSELKPVMPRELISVDELRGGKRLRPRSRRFSSFDELAMEFAQLDTELMSPKATKVAFGASEIMLALQRHKSFSSAASVCSIEPSMTIDKAMPVRNPFWHQDYAYTKWWK